MALTTINIGNKKITVDSSLAPKLALANQEKIAATGTPIEINQSFRSSEQQEKLYKELSAKGARVAPPGKSFHEKGAAVDVTNWQESQPFLNKYGLNNDLSDDKGHFSFGETRKYMPIKLENFSQKVELSRKSGRTDTQILDYLVKNDPNLAERIQISRNSYGKNAQGINNDRDLVNFLSQRYSGKVPATPSVAATAQPTKSIFEDPEVKALEAKVGVSGIAPTTEQPTFEQELARQQGLEFIPGRGIVAPEEKGFLQKMKESLAGSVKEFMGKTEATAERQRLGQQTLPETVLQGASNAINLVFDLGWNAAAPIVKKSLETDKAVLETIAPERVKSFENTYNKVKEAFSANPTIQEGLNFLKGKISDYDAWAKENPRAAADLGAAFTIATTLIGEKPASKALQEIKVAGKEAATGVRAGLTTEAKQVAREEVESIVNRIVQAKKKEEIAPAIRALSTIDTAGVKTASDLGSKLEKGTEKVLSTVDALYEQSKTLHKPNALVLTSQVGEKTVTSTPVKNAIRNLRELYIKTNDVANAERIKQLEQRMVRDGLTAGDVNQIAREYGTEFGSKAFGKTGEALTSVNAQAFENTRSQVKNVARKLTDNPEAIAALDKQASDLIKTRQLVKNVENKVAALEAKIRQENALTQAGRAIGRYTGKAVDLATGGTLRGFLTSFLPSNIGNKTLNYLDIQADLAKNLKTFDRLTKSTGKEFEKNLDNFIKETATMNKMILDDKAAKVGKPVLQVGDNKEFIRLPKNLTNEQKALIYDEIQTAEFGKKGRVHISQEDKVTGLKELSLTEAIKRYPEVKKTLENYGIKVKTK